MTHCNCVKAGYCTTHKRSMVNPIDGDDLFWRLCKFHPGYFEAFQKSKYVAKKPRRLGHPYAGQGCDGCEKRKKWLNEKIPGAGDLAEKITTATGIKKRWEERQRRKRGG